MIASGELAVGEAWGSELEEIEADTILRRVGPTAAARRMKRPRRRRRSTEESEGAERAEPSASSERAERERLREERRRRAAKAREDLGQKVGDPGARKKAEETRRTAEPRKKSGEVHGKDAGAARSEPGRRTRPTEKAASAGSSARRGRMLRIAKGKRRVADGAKRSRRSGARALGAKTSAAFKRGGGETRARLRQAAPIVGAKLLAVLAAAFALFFGLLAIVINGAIALVGLARGPVRRFLLQTRRAIDSASRILTPSRAMALVVVAAAILLALSQFADYRSVSIGNDDYADGIQTVAPAPERDREEAGSAHSYVFVPVAAVCLALLFFAMRGRWRLCRLIALGGAAAVVVALVVDRPAGLDPGTFAVRFNGAEANLLSGFYAQIFAGVLLTAASLMLGRELRLAGATAPALAPRGAGAGSRRPLRRSPSTKQVRA